MQDNTSTSKDSATMSPCRSNSWSAACSDLQQIHRSDCGYTEEERAELISRLWDGGGILRIEFDADAMKEVLSRTGGDTSENCIPFIERARRTKGKTRLPEASVQSKKATATNNAVDCDVDTVSSNTAAHEEN